MKRVFGTFLILFCCIIFSSCQNAPALDTTAPSTAEIVDGDTSYAVSIESGDDGMVLSLLSPANVKGLCYRYESDKLIIEYEGLRCITDNSYLPGGAFQNALYQAIESLPHAMFERSDNKTDYYSSKSGRFLITAEDGEPRKIRDTEYGFIFTFQD